MTRTSEVSRKRERESHSEISHEMRERESITHSEIRRKRSVSPRRIQKRGKICGSEKENAAAAENYSAITRFAQDGKNLQISDNPATQMR